VGHAMNTADGPQNALCGVRKGFVPLTCWAVTSTVVFIGAAFGAYFVSREPLTIMESVNRFDARNYTSIAENGYSYDAYAPSLVAFFPVFPLSSRWLTRVTGWHALTAELVLSNAFCVASFILAWFYLQRRGNKLPFNESAGAELRQRVPWGNGEQGSDFAAGYALLAMGVLPTTFFLRMPYTESLFLFLAILELYAMIRRWPPIVLALIVGLATATRPVGVALLPPFAWYVWTGVGSKRQSAIRIAWLAPIACWGLLAYMLFQYLCYHEPLAFALNQRFHRARPLGSPGDQVLSLLSLEPIRETYDPASPGYWQALFSSQHRLLSLECANPIYFLAAAALIVIGVWKRWLNVYEILLAIPLLAIPYFTRAYEMRMLSQARFASVVFPGYIVLGRLLAKLPAPISGSLLALSASLMGIYAALFAAGYPFF
jgi:hypothetical protein